MKFYIKKNRNNSVSIFADVNLKKLRFRMSTGYVINPNEWDHEKERVKYKVVNALKINQYLALKRAKIDEYIALASISDDNISLYEFKHKIYFILHPRKIDMDNLEKKFEVNPNDFFDTFKNWIQRRKHSGAYSVSRIKRYNSIYLMLQECQKFYGEEISFQRMDKRFEENLQAFLINQKHLVNNTIGLIVSVLKGFLNDIEDDLGSNLNSYFKRFKAHKDPSPPAFALTESEFSLIENVELKSEKEKVIRDLFVLQTYLLLRVSDLKRIKPENINRNTQVIKLTQIKTKELVTIPIPRKCIEILENWNYEIPNIHDQKYNKYLKIVAKKAGIDELFEAVRYSGINRIVNTKPKYEFISTHTARRTGITLLIRRGVPLNMIMKISGQKRIETIMRYVKLTQDEAVESVRLAWG